MDIILSLRVDKLKGCINNPKLVKEIVNKTSDNSELTADEKNTLHAQGHLPLLCLRVCIKAPGGR